MSDGRTRSIRDIAHLYISAPRSGTAGRRLLMAGVDRDCIPGFHVANLAVALLHQSFTVRVVEQSGLLLNAARFLALPARVYAALPGSRTTPSVVALDGLEVWFVEPPAPTGRVIDVIHAPPLDERAAFDRCAASTPGARTLLFARSRQEVPRDILTRATPRLLFIGPTGRGDSAAAGTLTRWRRSLADPLPALVRDRGCVLSRSYDTCARRLTVERGAAGDEPDAGSRARAG